MNVPNHEGSPPVSPTRSRQSVVKVWFITCAGLSVLSATASLAYSQLTYQPQPNVVWQPADEWANLFLLMPVGWLMSLFMPWGWINFAGLIWGLKKRSLVPLILSAIGAVTFGLIWPTWFEAMMSV